MTPTPATAVQVVLSPQPLIIAHRGYSKLAPENTLPAFRLGLGARADLIELDYYHTQDGIPAVLHDRTLDRTTDAQALWGGKEVSLHDRTSAQIKLLDAGRWFAPAFAGTRLPTLREALDVIQSGSMTLMEGKGGDKTAPWYDLSPRLEILKAEYVAQSYASALAAGADRFFQFILGQYVEPNGVQFGLLRVDFTPRPPYAALAAVRRFLAGARPLGHWGRAFPHRPTHACPQSASGLAQSKPWRNFQRVRSSRSGIDYGSPLPLFFRA
jgi:hypothetical protein